MCQVATLVSSVSPHAREVILKGENEATRSLSTKSLQIVNFCRRPPGLLLAKADRKKGRGGKATRDATGLLWLAVIPRTLLSEE